MKKIWVEPGCLNHDDHPVICMIIVIICCIIGIIPSILLGCGPGSSIDSITREDSSYETLVESNYRNVMLEWQPNSETNLAGYRVFVRADGKSYDYNNPEWETTDTDCKFYNLYKDTTYHFVVRAFNTEDEESGDSNEATLEEV